SAYRLYQAAFGREPDVEGLRYWIESMDSGVSLEQVAASFTASEEFLAFYGDNPAAETLVTGHYWNILGRAPEDDGLQYWVDAVNEGFSPASLLASFSESEENIALV